MENINKIFDVISQVQQVLNLETFEYQLLEGEKLANMLELYGAEPFQGAVFYNAYNLIFTNREDYEAVQYSIINHEVILRVEMSEYSACLIVVNYFNDFALSSVLE